MSTQKWILFLCSSLMVALVALAWLARPSFCLDSMLVEKIDRVSDGGTQSLMACQIRKSGNFSEGLQDIRKILEPRLHLLESEMKFLSLTSDQPPRVSVVESLDPFLRLHANHLMISRSLLEKPQVFEKAYLMSLLMQKSRRPFAEFSAEDKINLEVFSDLFVIFFGGELNLFDPTSGSPIQLNALNTLWPMGLRPNESYCQSPFRSWLDQASCERHDVSEKSFLLSTRPLLVQAVQKSFSKVPFNSQVLFLRNVFQNYSQLHFRGVTSGGQSVGPAEAQQLAEGRWWIDSWVRSIEKLMNGNQTLANRVVIPPVRAELEGLGLGSQSIKVSADLIVFENQNEVMGENSEGLAESSDSMSPQQAEELTQKRIGMFRDFSVLKPSTRVVYISKSSTQKSEVRILPETAALPHSWLPEITSHYGILLGCQNPSIQTLKELSAHVEQLLFVQDCSGSDKLKLSRLLQNGFRQFIVDNPMVNLVQFHLPSLKLALEKKSLNPMALLQAKKWESPFFRQIGWQEPEWDDGGQVYRARAAIEAIEYYRLSL